MFCSAPSQSDWQWLRSLDPATVEKLYRFGQHEETHLLVRLASIFLDVVPTQVAELHRALDRGDSHELARIAHALKGGWEMAGALRFAELCARLEQCANSGEISGCGGDLRQLEQEYVEVAADFRDLCSLTCESRPLECRQPGPEPLV